MSQLLGLRLIDRRGEMVLTVRRSDGTTVHAGPQLSMHRLARDLASEHGLHRISPVEWAVPDGAPARPLET